DQLSLVPCLAGLCWMVGGKTAWRWAWPAIAFLLFMIPLPFSLATALAAPLQRLATVCSTFVMVTLGLPAIAEGNVILLHDAQIGVVEACSGLRMLVVFFALSTALVLLVKRPVTDKIVLVLSAIPIALIANLVRITATGVLHEFASSDLANTFFHDVAGWFMMPLALGLLWLELKIIDNLFVPARGASGRMPAGLPRQPARALPPPPPAPAPPRPPRAAHGSAS